MEFYLLFVIVIFAVATFNSFVLAVKREKHIGGYRFLYISLFFYNFCLAIYYIWFEAGFIIEVPQLLRTFSPLMYLCAPFFYFFIRNTIFRSTGFRKRDWIHFLPALVHLLDLLPFYFESAEVKSAYAELLVSDHSKFNFEAGGLIPIQFHYLFRICLQTGYFAYSVYLVHGLRPEIFNTSLSKRQNYDITIVLASIGWLVVFQFAYAFFEVLIYFGSADLLVENYFLRRISLIGLLVLNLFVNFGAGFMKVRGGNKDSRFAEVDNDQIRGLNSQEADQPEKNRKSSTGQLDAIGRMETAQIKKEILSIMEKEQIFTEIGLTLNNFAKRIHKSPKLVSLVINNEFDKNFNEFLNQYRIAYSISKIEDGYLDYYTLEALGEMAGFNSRTTFFNAFKKAKGCSPSEYWKNFQQIPS